VADANRYFASEEPWVKRKTDAERFGTVLWVTAEVLRCVGILAQPVMPTAAGKLLDLLGVPADARMLADNPYADWILIRVYQSLSGIRSQMGQVIEAREAEFERLRRRGLALSVLASRSPVTVELGFRSPYGYATAEAIVEFDYHVRMVKTLVLKDRMSDEAGRAEIRAIGRGLRALFLEPIRWERNLLREEMLPLSRRDFLPGADEAARQRVRAAVALFGELPRKVFTGEEAPRHSQRRVTPTAAELRLMQQVSLGADAEPPPPSAGQLL